MTKVGFFVLLIAIIAIAISRRMRLSDRYERNNKKSAPASPWKAMDRGIDPTVEEKK